MVARGTEPRGGMNSAREVYGRVLISVQVSRHGWIGSPVSSRHILAKILT